MSRTARIERRTSESKVLVEVDLDGTGRHDISTGVGFYDHMLTAFARHGLLDLTAYESFLGGQVTDFDLPAQSLQDALSTLPAGV